jgi:hypothetical protein
VVLPRLPSGLEPQRERQQAEVGNGRLGQEGGSERGGHRHDEDRGEAQVLAQHDPAGRAAVAGPLGEEQRQDQDVVDVGDGEQSGCLSDDAQVHE